MEPWCSVYYTQDLYSSWVLLAYAAHESAISQFGKAALRVLAANAETPDDLPEAIRHSHLKRTLTFANELVGATIPRDSSRVDPETLVKRAYSDAWSTDSILMRLDRNAWPVFIREWLDRLGIQGERMQWMREPWPSGSETLESLVARLVQERNDLAHGVRPSAVLAADPMIDWASAVQEFARRTVGCLQTNLAESMGLTLDSIGTVGDLRFGPHTIPIAELAVAVRVDGHILCRDGAGHLRIGRVISMQHEGDAVENALAGSERLAITLNRSIEGSEFFAPI